MNWQRARTDDKKSERRQAIYDAAFTLFKNKGYENVSFNGIASEAGFTKSNMYRYFTSREEVFLSVFTGLFEKWTEDCISQLKKLSEEEPINNFAKVYVKTLMAHPHFLDLTPLMFISLEKNSSYEQLVVFKRQAKVLLFGIAMEIGRIYPQFAGEKAFKYLNLSHAATTNYWAANTHSEALKKIYEQDEFQDLKPDFENDLIAAIEVIIHGLKAV